jgi:hypothetical protein
MARNDLQQLLGHEGFDQEISGAAFQSLHSQLGVGVGGHDHHGKLGVLFSGLGQELQSVHAGQTEIGDQHLLYFGVNSGQGVFGALKGHVVYAAQTQRDADGFPQVGVVFNKENLKRVHE